MHIYPNTRTRKEFFTQGFGFFAPFFSSLSHKKHHNIQKYKRYTHTNHSTTMKTTACLLTFLTATASAFTTNKYHQARMAFRPLTATEQINDDDTNGLRELLWNAEQCAHSDSCSLEEAGQYYNVLSSDGTAAMEYGADYDLDGVLASLKSKMDRQKVWLDQQAAAFGTPMLMLGLATVYSSYMIAQSNGEVLPFEINEWKMALDGGYLDTMVAHFIRNGGL